MKLNVNEVKQVYKDAEKFFRYEIEKGHVVALYYFVYVIILY